MGFESICQDVNQTANTDPLTATHQWRPRPSLTAIMAYFLAATDIISTTVTDGGLSKAFGRPSGGPLNRISGR